MNTHYENSELSYWDGNVVLPTGLFFGNQRKRMFIRNALIAYQSIDKGANVVFHFNNGYTMSLYKLLPPHSELKLTFGHNERFHPIQRSELLKVLGKKIHKNSTLRELLASHHLRDVIKYLFLSNVVNRVEIKHPSANFSFDVADLQQMYEN